MNESQREDELLTREEQRAATYQLLAACYREPDQELVDLLEASDDEDHEIAVDELTAALPSDRERLRVDHAKLFVGPFELHAPPYESVYVDDRNRTMTESTVDVASEYRAEGLEVDLDQPADHVCAELEFTYVLVVAGLEALAAGDDDVAAEYVERQYDFLAGHLGRWVSEFAANIREHAGTRFYRLLADETQSFVETDGKRLADRLDADTTGRTEALRRTEPE